MKKFHLVIDGIRLHNPSITEEEYFKEKSMRVSLRVGGEGFEVPGIVFSFDKKGGLSQNWSGSRVKFHDKPVRHSKDENPKLILEEILGEAVHDIYMQGDKERLLSFINREISELSWPFCKPAAWNGRSLYVPVEFIALSHFEGGGLHGEVRANLSIGHHLTILKMLVYGDGWSGLREMNLIYNSEIVDLVNDLLDGEGARQYIFSLSKSKCGIIDHDRKLIDKSPSYCDPDSLSLPPVEFR